MRKVKLAGFAVAGLLLGAGVVSAEESAFPGSIDEAGIYLPSASTYADRYRNELEQTPTTVGDLAFPGSVDEAGIRLMSKSTYADQHRGRITGPLQAGSNISASPRSNGTN